MVISRSGRRIKTSVSTMCTLCWSFQPTRFQDLAGSKLSCHLLLVFLTSRCFQTSTLAWTRAQNSSTRTNSRKTLKPSVKSRQPGFSQRTAIFVYWPKMAQSSVLSPSTTSSCLPSSTVPSSPFRCHFVTLMITSQERIRTRRTRPSRSDPSPSTSKKCLPARMFHLVSNLRPRRSSIRHQAPQNGSHTMSTSSTQWPRIFSK